MAEIVDDGHTGLCFKPGDPADLAAKVRSIIANPPKLKCMRQAARRIFDQNFTAHANHEILMTIYDRAMGAGLRAELQN
jgi:glycosyltransferase involved in cell wall biosynthesis